MVRLVCLITVAATVALAVVGCGPAPEPQAQYFPQQQRAQDSTAPVVVVHMDASGSFVSRLGKDGDAWNAIVTCIDRCMRAGPDTEVFLVELSGTKAGFLFHGTVADLTEAFPDGEAFRQYVLKHSDPNASRLFDGIAESISYTLDIDGVRQKRRPVVCLTFSDLEETVNPAARARLQKALADLNAQARCAVAFYFVSQQELAPTRQMLQSAGFRRYVLEPSCRVNPPLPSFE